MLIISIILVTSSWFQLLALLSRLLRSWRTTVWLLRRVSHELKSHFSSMKTWISGEHKLVVLTSFFFFFNSTLNGAEILTSTVGTKDDTKGRLVRKARVGLSLPPPLKLYIYDKWQFCNSRSCKLINFNFFRSLYLQIEILLHKSENFNNLVPATKADQIKAVQPEIEA